MSLSCTLNLVACLLVGDKWIPETDVLFILDTCPLVAAYPSVEFVRPGDWGSSTATHLIDKGLPITAAATAAARRGNAIRACMQFEKTALRRENWKNLDKSKYAGRLR